MKIIYKDKTDCILKFIRGEEAVTGITAFCKDNNITAGWINALGACQKLQLAYFNDTSKKYENHDIDKKNAKLEVVGITGNVGLYINDQMIHIHGSFGGKNIETISGHINSLEVGPTLEVYIRILQGTITRELDDDTCLKLMV